MGAYVQGAPRQPRSYNNNYNSGFGGNDGRGYGQGGRGGASDDM